MRPLSSRTADEERAYRALLHKHLPHLPATEIDFFVNRRRFRILESEIGELLRRPGVRVLNVAGGPFALEFYLLGTNAEVHSLDMDPALPALHADLVGAGLIADTPHRVSDVESFDTAMRYDIVIINDLLYNNSLSFEAVFERYRRFVRADGMLYFDLLDSRAGPLWRAFNKDSRYRRYDLADIRRALDEGGFDIEAQRPSLGIKGGMDTLARRVLWHGFRIANNHIFRARRRRVTASIMTFASGLAAAFAEQWRVVEGVVLAFV